MNNYCHAQKHEIKSRAQKNEINYKCRKQLMPQQVELNAIRMMISIIVSIHSHTRRRERAQTKRKNEYRNWFYVCV